jgi:hypothetical protein
MPMLEFLNALFEAIWVDFIGRFIASRSLTTHISLIVISVALGISFFLVFGAYELIFPVQNPHGNIWIGLLCFSLGISFLTYLVLLIEYLIKLQKKDN